MGSPHRGHRNEARHAVHGVEAEEELVFEIPRQAGSEEKGQIRGDKDRRLRISSTSSSSLIETRNQQTFVSDIVFFFVFFYGGKEDFYVRFPCSYITSTQKSNLA